MTGSKIYGFTSECQKIYESAGSYTTLCVIHTNACFPFVIAKTLI